MASKRVHPYLSTSPAERQMGERLNEIRRLGRVRQLRIQLPLACCACVVGAASFVAGIAARWTVISTGGMALAPWLLLLCAMPGDVRATWLGICFGTLSILVACVYQALPYLRPNLAACPTSRRARARRSRAGRRTRS